MKLQHPLLIGAAATTLAWSVRRVVGTCRFHFRYADPMLDPAVARRSRQRFIYAFYHEVMLFPLYFWSWPEMQILISDHRDGELVTQVVTRMGFGVVRGSSTRGGARALREMRQRVDRGHLCVTPDGPRGPRRCVHQGLPYLASRTGLPVVAAGMAFQDPWRVGSWDRFAVPRPFCNAVCVAPEAIRVPPDADRETIEAYRLLIEQRMQAATAEAETWADHLSQAGAGPDPAASLRSSRAG
jgi:lysophospholipid acyltransferase (LPLAT)-like uncharacterized protein